MCVPACTVISTTLETKPLSSHLMIGLSLKYFSSGAKGAESHSSTVMLRSTIRIQISSEAIGRSSIPPAQEKVNAAVDGAGGAKRQPMGRVPTSKSLLENSRFDAAVKYPRHIGEVCLQSRRVRQGGSDDRERPNLVRGVLRRRSLQFRFRCR